MSAIWLLTAWQAELDPFTRLLLIITLVYAILALYWRTLEP